MNIKNLKYDIPASIVVLFVAIPLCLGIAMASGAPLISGVIAGIVGGIVVGYLSGSALGVSGPAAGLAVIVLNSITSLGSFEVFLLAVVIAGIIQVILSILKAGVIGYYFPSSVIKGMLAGIGIVIILKQIPHAVGLDRSYPGDFSFFQFDGRNTFSELASMLEYLSPSAIFLSATSLAMLILWEKVLADKHAIFKLIQGPIVVVVWGVVFQYFTMNFMPSIALSPEHLVMVPVAESIAGIGNLITFPDFGQLLNPEVYIVAITLAIVASLETLLSVEATDKLDPQKRETSTNTELKAQGIGNIVSGLIGGLPITQVIVRSSANIQSGARSKMSAIMHGFLLLLLVLLLPKFLNFIPLAGLAAILLMVGYKLTNPTLFSHMHELGKEQLIPFVVTILGIIFTDLLIGIGLGLIVGLFIILLRNYRNSHFLHMEDKLNSDDHHKVKITFSEEVTFLNKAAIRNELCKIEPESEVTIDMSKSVRVDYDVLEIIDNFKHTAADKGIKVKLMSRGDKETLDY
ncbi:MAG: SulP family inorganic anion transporter [Bacteroidota bacterium]